MITDETNQGEVLSIYNEALEDKKTNKSKSKNEDILNITFLIILYIVQAIPFGVATSIPLILSTRKVSYSDQGIYSFAIWPFSIKLLWAPIVDAFFIKKFGRRKTWVVFCQLTTGILMVSLAGFVNKLIESKSVNKKNDIYFLALIFGIIVFLCATQDTALDGWSLDLLMEKNAPYQALCNSIGMGTGQFIGNSGFLILESVKFSNEYIRPFLKLPSQSHGIATIENFFYIFGSISIIFSILIFLFKGEYNSKKLKVESERLLVERHEQACKNRSILDTYKLIWGLFYIKPIRYLLILMVTCRIAFPTENIIRIKLVEEGFAREKVALLGVLLSPILVLFPIFFAKILKGKNTLISFRVFYALKIFILIIYCIFLYLIPQFRNQNYDFSLSFYIYLFILNLINGIFSFGLYMTIGGFNAKISDRIIGGTYMTFLSFWPNLAGNFFRTSALFIVNLSTFKTCDLSNRNETIAFNTIAFNTTVFNTTVSKSTCSNEKSVKECLSFGGKCEILFDSFYPFTAFLFFIGFLWIFLSKKYIKRIQALPKSDWAISL